MLEFIQLLKQRYQASLAQLDKRNPRFTDYQQRVEQLLLAEGVIRKGQIIQQQQQLPLQIAVIGPTQAGKSSIVNLLLGANQAGVSPLAGYTVHPHGFAHRLAPDALASLQHYFGRFQQLPACELSPTRYDCYALTPADRASDILPACVLWDTPDFDSIDAADYQEGVIRTMALADVLVLVVSKEKYADQSVWTVMARLSALQQPTLICVNKLVEGSEAIITASLQDKWRQTRHDAFPEVVTLLFSKHDELAWPVAAQHTLHTLAKRATAKQHAERQQHLLQAYWQTWLEPVFAEQQARKNWQLLVEHHIKQLANDYQRDYLNHPHHYETFQAALLNLLNLLDIPGLETLLGHTRRLMTWPVRKLLSLGQKHALQQHSHEVTVLKQLGEHLLLQLSEQVLEKVELDAANSHWWKAALSSLRQQKAAMLHRYATAIEAYHHDFQHDVEEAAHKLYRRLQQHPLILNSLRATRLGTDAAGMALVLQTGGIGLHDLLLTPAMLTITSLLAESAIGSYMQRVEAELKHQQLARVRQQLFEQVLRNALLALPEHFAEPPRFYIPAELIHQAEQSLQQKRHGLRIL